MLLRMKFWSYQRLHLKAVIVMNALLIMESEMCWEKLLTFILVVRLYRKFWFNRQWISNWFSCEMWRLSVFKSSYFCFGIIQKTIIVVKLTLDFASEMCYKFILAFILLTISSSHCKGIKLIFLNSDSSINLNLFD
jgi:hypothetical protein